MKRPHLAGELPTGARYRLPREERASPPPPWPPSSPWQAPPPPPLRPQPLCGASPMRRAPPIHLQAVAAFLDCAYQPSGAELRARLFWEGMATPEQLVLDLITPEQRENALLDLSKKREAFPDLAPILWHSCSTIAALLQEIVSIYPMLSPPTLTAGASNRVCNALALLQCVASHPETRALFLNAHIPLYLYPFLNTVSKTRPFEYLRLTSLGVIGALVKVDDTDVINFLLSTEIIPLCLRTMEMGSELSKTVATFIVQKILLDDVGLSYICATAERFFAVGAVLANMVQMLAEQQSVRLLKHIIRCYLRLSDNPRACEALRNCLPDLLRDQTFSSCLRDDPTTKRWLSQLLMNVGPPLHSQQRGPSGLVGASQMPHLDQLPPSN